jgi:hypothetical protein
LELKPAAINAELIRDRFSMRDAADVMRPKRGRHNGVILKKHARKLFEIRVALGLLKKNRRI